LTGFNLDPRRESCQTGGMKCLAYAETQVAPLETSRFDLHALMADTRTLRFKRHDGTYEEFHPDETKGFFEFHTGFGFPTGDSVYNTGLHPQTLANSFRTLHGQSLDYDHRKQIHNPKLQGDHYLGYIAAIDFPRAPSTEGWKLTDKAPHISGVAGFWKQAAGLKRILGEHITGRHQWTISYDVKWGGDEQDLQKAIAKTSSFAVELALKSVAAFDYSPQHFLDAGYEYIPGDKAPKDLLATVAGGEDAPVRVIKPWRGRKVSLLFNEQVGSVHFAGIALVRYGAERAANIKTVVASGESPLAASIEGLREVMGQIFVQKIVKRTTSALP